jgi:hypothetical protein
MGCLFDNRQSAIWAETILRQMRKGEVAEVHVTTSCRQSLCEILQPRMRPVEISGADWAVWESYAAQTYDPVPEASRLSGAGLTDND